MKAICILFAIVALTTKVGGFSDSKPVSANQDLMNILNNIKPALEEKGNIKYSVFNPVVFQSQVVAGTNYKVKIDIGNSEYIHIKIYVPLPFMNKPPSVVEVISGMTLESPL